MFQKCYNKNKREDIDMKFEKKKSLIQLFLTDRLWSALGILILIFGVILVFAFLAGLVFILTHTPKWIFKYMFFALLGGAVFFCIIAAAINNAGINRDIEKDKILTVWSKPMYSYVDFGFRVTPRCDSICGFTSNSHIINYKESMGRRI